MSNNSGADEERIKYKGVRRRKWGKWVSEIRVPGTQERLWLGSYSSPEAAAVAHDIASYCLKGGSSSSSPSNFPLPPLPASFLREDMSPKSVQRAASDAGMAVDARMILRNSRATPPQQTAAVMTWGGGEQRGCGSWEGEGAAEGGDHQGLNISVDDYL